MRVVTEAVRRQRLARATARVIRPGTKAAADLARRDDGWWQDLSVAERVLLASQLSLEQWRLHGWQEDTSRDGLSRSVTRVRRPRRPIPRGRSVRPRRPRAAPRHG